MARTRLSTRGQLVIPKDIRDRHGWTAGAELTVEDRGDCLILRTADGRGQASLADLVGCAGYRGPRRSLGDMERAIAKGARARR